MRRVLRRPDADGVDAPRTVAAARARPPRRDAVDVAARERRACGRCRCPVPAATMPSGRPVPATTFTPRCTMPSPPTTTSASRPWTAAARARSVACASVAADRSSTLWPRARRSSCTRRPACVPRPLPAVGLTTRPRWITRCRPRRRARRPSCRPAAAARRPPAGGRPGGRAGRRRRAPGSTAPQIGMATASIVIASGVGVTTAANTNDEQHRPPPALAPRGGACRARRS